MLENCEGCGGDGMKNLLYRLTVEDLVALMLVTKIEDGDIDGHIVDVCTKRDIYCDVEYLAQLRLIKKTETENG